MTLITSFSKISTIAIILSLFLQTSTTISEGSPFTKIPTTPILSLIPDHHSLYPLPLISTNQAPCLLHLTSCKQHVSTFVFLNCSYTFILLPQKLPTFQLPNLTTNFCNPEILCTLCPFKSYWELGPIL